MNDDRNSPFLHDFANYTQRPLQKPSSISPSGCPTKMDYAFHSHVEFNDDITAPDAQPGLPLWRSSGDALGPGPSSHTESFGFSAGLAQVQAPHDTSLADQVFQPNATWVEYGQTSINRNWTSAIGGPLQEDVLFGSDARDADTPDCLLGKISGPLDQTVMVHDDQAVLSPSTLASIPVAPVPTLDVGSMQQMPPTLDAVTMQREDGLFFCSQVGCDATYARIGDCRRHLKKHNGPFFYCDHGCGMGFYRHDKLRAHMQQGHGIVIQPPGNRRRQRRGVTGQ